MNRASQFMFFQGGQVLLGARATTYDADAATLFAAMTTPPTTARKAQINTLILALKAAGVWTLLDVFYVLAAADSQAARLNWKNPAAFTALAVNSPTFAADRGYTGDGSSSRLRTQFTPSVNGVNYTQNDASAWLWNLTESQDNTGHELGNTTTPRTFTRIRNTSNQAVMAANSGSTSTTVANSVSLGFFGTQRVSGTTVNVFKNGASLGTSAPGAAAITATEQWICGANSTGFSARQIALAAWGASLTSKEAAFYSALLTYMQAVGAA